MGYHGGRIRVMGTWAPLYQSLYFCVYLKFSIKKLKTVIKECYDENK